MIRFLSFLAVCAVITLPMVASAKPEETKMPMRKTDSQITQEMERYPYGWNKMTSKEKEDYSKKLIEDRFIVTTQNFRVIETGLGSKLCTLNTILVNNSSREIHKIHINYKWGDTSTFMTFEKVPPASKQMGTLSMSGQVCSEIMNGSDYEIEACDADGLTEEQCKLRVFKIK